MSIKNCSNKLLFLLFIGFQMIGQLAATAQSKAATIQLFKIQLGAFRNLSLGKFDKLKTNELKAAVYSEDLGNGIMRVFVGDYKKQSEVEKALEKVKTLGFEGAYIVAFEADEKGIIKPKETPPSPTSKEMPATKNSKAPSTTTTNTNMTETKNTTKPKEASISTPALPLPEIGRFWIQLGAFTQPDLKVFGNVADLGELFIDKVGEQTKITIGTYTKRSDAEKILNVVKKRGYAQAFIRVE